MPRTDGRMTQRDVQAASSRRRNGGLVVKMVAAALVVLAMMMCPAARGEQLNSKVSLLKSAAGIEIREEPDAADMENLVRRAGMRGEDTDDEGQGAASFSSPGDPTTVP